MKKIGVYVIIIIIVIAGAIFLKNIATTKYSHADIVALINKGKQSMEGTSNLYYENDNERMTTEYYFKNDKKKMVYGPMAIVLEDGKSYVINKKDKKMLITDIEYVINKGLQKDALHIEELNSEAIYKDQLMYKFEHIRDEKIEDKDCILVKECVFNLETKEYSDYYNDRKERAIYWIEKSTGFVIGYALLEFGNNTLTPQTIIRNIKFEEIEDSVFEIPNDYNVFE